MELDPDHSGKPRNIFAIFYSPERARFEEATCLPRVGDRPSIYGGTFRTGARAR